MLLSIVLPVAPHVTRPEFVFVDIILFSMTLLLEYAINIPSQLFEILLLVMMVSSE
jgi:hypothetical protein